MTLIDARHAPGGTRILRIGTATITMRPRAVVVTIIVTVAALGLAFAALFIGSLAIAPDMILPAIFGAGDDRDVRVIQQIRLPRVLTALAAGAALGVSGGVFQSVSRNALGSPDIIGFTTGAATGAITMIVVFDAPPLQVALGALVGGTCTALAVMVLARTRGATRGRQLVLVGIGVGAILGAVNGLLLVRGNLDQSVQANLWLSGSLDARGWEHAIPVLLGVAVGVPIVLALAAPANLIELGDDVSTQLGVQANRVRIALVVCAVVLASLATAATGPIAFIALAAPQLARRLTKAPEMPVVSAAAMGAALLIAADVVTQLSPLGFTLPIGRMTGVIGGLYLIWLLVPGRQRVTL